MTSVQTSVDAPAVSRWGTIRGALSRREWSTVIAMFGFVLLLHVVGWGVLGGVIEPQNLTAADGQKFGFALGLTAYVLGMRHAFDADHIAAIDTTTRKLVVEERKPVSVGFWFSLGHSSVVFGLCLLLAFGVKSLLGQVQSDSSGLKQFTGIWGPSISGVFLILLGLINVVSMIAIWRVRGELKHGDYDEAALEHELDNRGLLNRILKPAMRIVRHPRHMYGIGFLFGLGFDTATEVGLLVIAGTSAAIALPWYAIVVLPILFAAGMSLLDSIDGLFMNFAYGWAFSRPVRKVYYNLTVTVLSVGVALIVGIVELAGVVVNQLGITTGPLAAVGNLPIANLGYIIAGLFVLTWLVALAWWRIGRVEEKWGAGLITSPPAVPEP